MKYSTKTHQLRRITCLIPMVLLLTAPIISKAEQMVTQDIIKRLTAIEALPDQDRTKLLRDNGEYLREIRATLLKELTAQDLDTKCYSIYLLGEYRFPEAAEALAKRITLKARIRENSHEWFWDLYPAVEALIKIGNPAIDPVIRNLEDSDDDQLRILSLKVIYFVDGRDKEIAALRLRRAVEKLQDARKKERLEAALQDLKEMH